MTNKKRKGLGGSQLDRSSSNDCGPQLAGGSWSYLVGVASIALLVGWVNSAHVASLFENDRHFSHLSNLEREMTFRTEMGLYYSYFKTLVTAESLSEGTYQLYRNNVTEFPLVINTLKRFNLYPEMMAGAIYRSMNSLGMLSQQCYTVNRGQGLEPVQSCEGLKDPPHFYIRLVWILAGLTTTLLFLLGLHLSGSILGGLLAVLCFFFNHSECTRVMWTPPLRESFAFPVCLAQVLAVSVTTRNPRPGWRNILSVSSMTTLFIVFWQFAQFMLFTQTCAVVAVYLLGCMSRDTLHSILVAQVIGLLHAVVLMFGNEMLFTSWLFSCLLSALLLTLPLDSLLSSFSPLLRIISSVFLFFGLMVIFKISIAKAFLIQDDAHVFEILKSKFTDFKNFHTLLYTCAVEFDFLGWEMPFKTTLTLLIPSAVLAVFLFLVTFLHFFWRRFIFPQTTDTIGTEKVDPAALYNILQTAAYMVMAVLIMRLKLFLTPHLCVLTSFLCSAKYTSRLVRSRNTQLAVLAGLVACMSVQGVANIREQQGIMGEYSNVELEQLIDWINNNLSKTAVLAGPMPTMANLLLSTGRPIVNHPHYEDVGLRERTKQVYTVFSRRDPSSVLMSLQELRVEYLVMSGPWCLTTQRGGCALTEVWDIEEPELKERGKQPVCPILWERPPKPFVKVFQNKEYAVLQISPRVLELNPPKVQDK